MLNHILNFPFEQNGGRFVKGVFLGDQPLLRRLLFLLFFQTLEVRLSGSLLFAPLLSRACQLTRVSSYP